MGVRQRVTILAVVLVAVAGMVAPATATQDVKPLNPEPTSTEPLTTAVTVDEPAGGSAANETVTNETATDETASTANDTSNETAPLGSQISAFMQSTSATADESVESGMWEARFETANRTNQSTMVDRRAAVLETRLQRLQAELEGLNSSDTPGLADVSHAARVASLTTRISALESTLNKTSTVAAEAGVNRTRLDQLRENASSLNGRAVSKLARGLTVVENPGRGPPADRGPPDDRNGNESDGGPPNGDGPGNGQGPPDDRNGSESDGGPPNGDGPENGQGPPDDGNGNASESGPSNGNDSGNGQGPTGDSDPSNGSSGQSSEEETDEAEPGPPGMMSGPRAAAEIF